MKRLYFARHGEATNTVRGVWESDSKAPLTKLGREQATAEGKKAKEMGYKFDIIVSSPVTRAKQTAEIIAKQVGFPVKNIDYSDLFREQFYGDLEGTLVVDFVQGKKYRNMDDVPNVETLKSMHERAEQAHEYLLNRPEHNILVVSHSGFGRALRRIIESKPHTYEHIEHTSIPHAEIVLWVEPERKSRSKSRLWRRLKSS